LHSAQTDNHVPFSWTYADAAARTGAIGFVAADVGKFALQSDTKALYMLTDTAPTWVQMAITGSTSDVTADAAWDAKGDLVAGTGANAAARLAVGTNGKVLTAASGETTGLEWATPITVATDAIWDTKGDLAAATAANTASKLAAGSNGKILMAASGEATGLKWEAVIRYLTLGMAGTLTVAAGTARLYVPFACTITNVRASVGTAPTDASLVADVHLNGTTIFTTQGNRPTITTGAYTDLTSAPDVTAIAANDYLTLDVSAVGSSVAGADLMVVLEVTIP
jgi:hypothetical protein